MLKWGHGKETETGICGGCLSRNEQGESPTGDIPHGRGPEFVFDRLGGGVRTDGLDCPCVRSDGQPLPFSAGNAGSEFGDGDAVAARNLYQTVQRGPPGVGASVPRAIQGDSR